MKVKEESEKVGLKLSIQKTKVMASSPITSWQIDGEKVEIEILFSWAPKPLWMITAGTKLKDTCSRIKAMINLDNVLKSRDIILLTKVHIVKAMVFPVVIYGCDSWTIKKGECQIVDTFELC